MSTCDPTPDSVPRSRTGLKGFGPIPRWPGTAGYARHAIFDLPRIRAQLKHVALGPLSAYNPALDWLTKQIILV